MTEITTKIKPEIFFINFNEIQGRLDPYFYFLQKDNLLKKIKKSKFEKRELSEIAELKRGTFTFRPRNHPKFYGGKYPFIQTGNIVEASNNNKKIKFDKTLNEEGLKVSKLFTEKLILITIAANIGDTAILNYSACFPDSIVAIKPNKEYLILEYLNYYLKFLKKYLERLAPQSAQKNLNLEQLSPTPIIIPPKKIQKQIITLMDNAYNFKKQNEEKAKELIDGIDDFVLEKLEIKIPKIEEKMCFVINSKEVENNRIDAEFHQEKYKMIEKILKNEKNLNKIARIERGVFIPIEKYNSGNKKYIRIGDLKYNNFLDNKKVLSVDFEGRSGKVFKGEILMTVIGATIGKNVLVQKENDGNYFSSNLVKIIAKDKNINSEFLAIFLQSSFGQEQIFRNSTMTAQPKINEKELSNLKIPIPPLEIQKEIAEEVKKRLEKAKELKKSASEELRTAKEKVEEILLD